MITQSKGIPLNWNFFLKCYGWFNPDTGADEAEQHGENAGLSAEEFKNAIRIEEIHHLMTK